MSLAVASLFALTLSGVVPARPAVTKRAVALERLPILTDHIPKRLLRGDFETPNVVVFVFEPEWQDSLDRMINITSEVAGILLIVPNDLENEASEWLAKTPIPKRSFRVLELPLDSPWIRDFGPFQLVDTHGKSVLLDTLYDRPDRPNDDTSPTDIASMLGMPVEHLPLPIDGGALVSNGSGLCVMTKDSFEQTGIDPTDREARELSSSLGCRALALIGALTNEETKHADISVQFASRDHVLIGRIDPRESAEDSAILEEATDTIEQAAHILGINLKVTRIDLPVLKKNAYRTYVNGLRLADVYLVPSYGDVSNRRESRALRTLARALKHVRIIPIEADAMIDLMGAVHCLSLGLNAPGAGPGWGTDRLHR